MWPRRSEGAITVNGRVRHRRKTLEDKDLGDQDADMPRPKIPDATVDQVIELLLCGWTPQNVVEGWPEVEINHSHDGYGCPSLVSVQRIARAEGLARQRGAQPGRSRPAGSGRKATGFGTGTKHRTHAKWSPHRARASELRAEGLSFNVIAGILGITRQGVQKILSDEI
jgi:hypothetical protein